ncbi:caspase-1-like isoform X2 [Macaca fascicularis]|uniref:caspase-1-like isoform X2 n=1 Tax=Macaca fascicularis TaxID=9541 RepID=UPI003D15B9D0
MDKSSRTRLALIICNEEFDSLSKRTGAEVDIIGITMLLQNLGYKVDVKRNLTASELPKFEGQTEGDHHPGLPWWFNFRLSSQMIKHRCPALKE